MAEITGARTGELLRKLFEILLERPEGMQARHAVDKLAASVKLTPYEAGEYEGGIRRFEKIVRFGTVDCVKAGWLIKHKGTWLVTDEGLKALKTIPDPEAFYRKATQLYRAWKAIQPTKNGPAPVQADEISEESPETSAAITFEQAEEQAWDEIEKHLQAMNPYDFQQLVADLLKAMGYHIAWISPPGKDGGVDIIAYTDPLGARPPRIKVQVKRHVGDKVTADGLKSFLAIVNDHDVGLYVSMAGFTRDAEAFARGQERRQVTLINLERLVELWIEHGAKLDDQARPRLPLTPIYFLTPES